MNVRTLCLGVLQFGEATGYEIKKMVEEGMFNHFIEASYGSIYPALTRMSREGLVTCREEAQSGKPDKKIYSITPAGRAELVRTLSAVPRADKFKSEFLFVMLLADLMPKDHIAGVLGQRINEMRAELEEMRACGGQSEHMGSRFVVGYGIAVYEAGVRYLEENRDLLTATEMPESVRLTSNAGAAE
jgi:DNA-binding PadR family transcriptional regulator